jgi:glycosyltransferase involved in cell wall biosynthesis
MNLLLITYSFPPAAGVGVLRAHSLAKYLAENGIHVDVLTARNAAAVGQDASLLTQLPPTVAIHRTWTLDLPFALRKAIKKLVSRKPKQQPATNNQQPATSNLLKRLLANLLLPDPQIGWLPFALPAATRLIRSRKIDAVLITVPPFSSALLVTRLRRRFPHLPIVLDFRDEWLTTTLHLVSFNANQRARSIAARTEAEAVRDSTAVVCVTEAAVAELQKRYPHEATAKFSCIPNGYDTPPPTSPAQSTPNTTAVLTYIGTVYGSTDPTPVVNAILQLPQPIRDQLHLRFIGYIETPAFRETLLRLGPQVELIGFLPQSQALDYIRSTDYLLLITHDPINVAAKLYDYLGSSRPILAAVHPTGDVRRIVDQTHAGWSADIANPIALQQLFTDAVTRLPHLASTFQPDLAAIASYHRKPLAARYATLLHSLTTTVQA